MKKIGFITLGCKVNIYESNALKNELTNYGYEIVEPTSDCDCFVINTCSVTNMADAKSRKMIHKCIKMNPSAIICVMGCYSQTSKEEAQNIEGIDILIGNGNKKEAALKIKELLDSGKKERYVNIIDILEQSEYEALDVTTFDHTRAFVKIEDGCENYCAFCIIPYARGKVRCKDSDSVIKELQNISNMGYKEVVLAGIHTGRYNDGKYNLTKLIKRILNEVPEIKRIRLSSIEINEVDDEFIELMKNNKIIANHMHLPLQSGSDKILKIMERRYDRAYFIDKVNKIKSVRPDISITTDIIVGFPYEEESDFIDSMNLASELGMSKLHVFPYSRRKNTKAASMPQVKDEIKKERVARLIELSNKLEKEYYDKFINHELDVIFEQKYGDYIIGHTSNFLQVIVKTDLDIIGKQLNVKLIKIIDNKLYGEII